ncbi:sulfite exporter TauE/SafE family protein [Marinobacterium arenosum]|uniref:sulfite exporter TauE/SafE family protein n=1 Tax=Marinobacterium arenosum TaxID=2862496 RepID=UPI001C989ED8|nr:sulfite exporter TauE/SafE family protein [Marinobacterium arenosum]MBY4675579.1 sulfite exporter TauE/SafE family protein [Marinobacterium arenosum]
MELLPASIDLLDALLLILTAGFTSLITAAMGIGGGVLLLAVMATLVPAAALIPVHGLVQLGSNANRALMTRRHTDWTMVKWFLVGAVAGALLASLIVVQLPLSWIQFSVAGFILYLVWGPKPGKHALGRNGQVIAGGLTTLVSMFVGATGPLVAGFVHRHGMDKFATTATFASCMSLQHLLKMLVFSVVGFAFLDWLVLIAAMIAAGVVGTWLGLKLLNQIPAQLFSTLFRWIVTLLALRLLWQAAQATGFV